MIRVPLALMIALVLLVAGLAAWTIFGLVRGSWQRVALDAPVQRGRAIAERMGCFGCHGPGGGQAIKNPGAKGEEVPSWPGGTWMMYNRDEDDVRRWIVDGHPAHREPDSGALIKMPAFGDRLRPKETDDLVAYVLAASEFGSIDDEKAAAGHEAALRLGCLGCHGSEGRGLVMNPGSLKGYIPPWDGDDFTELVHDDAELGQWIHNGISDRFRANPIARRIVETETIKMPAFRERATDRDVTSIAAYVQWVRAHPRTGAPKPADR